MQLKSLRSTYPRTLKSVSVSLHSSVFEQLKIIIQKADFGVLKFVLLKFSYLYLKTRSLTCSFRFLRFIYSENTRKFEISVLFSEYMNFNCNFWCWNFNFRLLINKDEFFNFQSSYNQLPLRILCLNWWIWFCDGPRYVLLIFFFLGCHYLALMNDVCKLKLWEL